MSLGNHSFLMQSENYWRYSSSCYIKTTRRLIVNGVVRHSLIFSSLISVIFSALSYLLVSDVGDRRI